MNLCLDDAITHAVVAFSSMEFQRVKRNVDLQNRSQNHMSLELIAHMMSHIGSALLAHTALLSGKIGMDGSTGKLLGRNLESLETLAIQLANNTRVG